MNMQEMSRLILGLRDLGLTGDEVNDFLLYIESGDENYKPRRSGKIGQEGEESGNRS